MALNDVKVHFSPYDSVSSLTYIVAASATTIKAGDVVSLETASGTGAVITIADASPTTTTAVTNGLRVVGVAATTSTNTSGAAGSVEVFQPLPGIIWKAKAKTASTADTQAEIDAKQNDCILLDVTAGVVTVDFAASHSDASGIQVVGGNPDTQEIYFQFRSSMIEGKL